METQPNESIKHFYLFYIFLCPNLFQPYVLFVSRLYGVKGCSYWPAKPRAIQRALSLTGSLPGERSLDLHRATRRNRSDRPTKSV